VLLGVDVMWVPVAQPESVDLLKIPITVGVTRQGDTFVLSEPLSDDPEPIISSILDINWHPSTIANSSASCPLVITSSVVTRTGSSTSWSSVVARPALPSNDISYWNICLTQQTNSICIGIHPYDTPKSTACYQEDGSITFHPWGSGSASPVVWVEDNLSGCPQAQSGDVLQFRYDPSSKRLSMRCQQRYGNRVFTLTSTTPKQEAFIAVTLHNPNDAVELIHTTERW